MATTVSKPTRQAISPGKKSHAKKTAEPAQSMTAAELKQLFDKFKPGATQPLPNASEDPPKPTVEESANAAEEEATVSTPPSTDPPKEEESNPE
jgi:hypothetical protein